MRLPLAALSLFLAVPAPLADDGAAEARLARAASHAFAALNARLTQEGSGLAERYETCPADDSSQWGFEFVHGFDIKPVGAASFVVLADTGQCSGGNKHGQYVAIAAETGARLVLADVIGDMRFLVERYIIGDGTVEFSGQRWRDDDPHCCPSQTGRLVYTLRSGSARFVAE